MIEEVEALDEALKADILAIMGSEETHTEGAAKASNITVTSSRLDSTSLKKALPDVFQQYSKTSSYKRFTIA